MTTHRHGPKALRRMATLPGASLAIIMGTNRGWTDLGPFSKHAPALRLQRLDAADAVAQDDPEALGIRVSHGKLRVSHGFQGGNHGELRETVHAARFLGLQEPLGHEVLHLPGDLGA